MTHGFPPTKKKEVKPRLLNIDGVERPRRIEVSFSGTGFPNACSGTLEIKEDGKVIYSNDFCCRSTGSVWFDDDWGEHVESGELIWEEEEAEKFDKEIQEAVRDVLSEVYVCCGGCV